jgi:hypothetical protein
MNSGSFLVADETLDGFPQTDLEINRETQFEIINMENSNSSDVEWYVTHLYSYSK